MRLKIMLNRTMPTFVTVRSQFGSILFVRFINESGTWKHVKKVDKELPVNLPANHEQEVG
jgi:hypothetical protein